MEKAKPVIWSRLQPHGGTTVPKEIRDALKLVSGDVLLWTDLGLGKAALMKGSVKEVSQEWPHKTSK